MRGAEIRWSRGVVPYADILRGEFQLSHRGFYAVLVGEPDEDERWWGIELLYIGMAFRQTVTDRAAQPHAAAECVNSYLKANPDGKLLVMTGEVAAATVKRLTEQFYRDVECCLIFKNQPPCNVLCKDSCPDDIHVVNSGDHWPLRRTAP